MILKGSNALIVKYEAVYAQTRAVPYQNTGYKYVDNGVFFRQCCQDQKHGCQ